MTEHQSSELNGSLEKAKDQLSSDISGDRQLRLVLEKLTKLETQLKRNEERIAVLESENASLKHRLEQQGFDGIRADILELKRGQKEEKSLLQRLHTQTSIPPFEFTIHKFSQLKKDNEQWYSLPFYTHPHGYKMCLKVYPNGDGPGKNSHMLVSIRLMRGEFDSYLTWPFRAAVTVMLINQEEDKKHIIETLEFSDHAPESAAGRVTSGERAQSGVGNPHFYPHSKLKPKYLKHDCVRLMVTKVEFM